MVNDLEKHIESIYGDTSSKKRQEFENKFEEYRLGQMFKEIRLQSGLTQQELAIKANMKRSAISRVETSNKNITIATMEKVAKALGKKLHFVFK